MLSSNDEYIIGGNSFNATKFFLQSIILLGTLSKDDNCAYP